MKPINRTFNEKKDWALDRSKREAKMILILIFQTLNPHTLCKCFTYVAKTRANLTTYSRKPENYNDTIIFEIDIMKNSSPINLNLGQT